MSKHRTGHNSRTPKDSKSTTPNQDPYQDMAITILPAENDPNSEMLIKYFRDMGVEVNVIEPDEGES